jgi:membrane-bound lytic murein transglycosylase D
MIKALAAVPLLALAALLQALPAQALDTPSKNVAQTTPSLEAPARVDVQVEAVFVDIPEPDLWQRIRSGLAMADSEDPLVATHEAGFVRRVAELRRTFERSRPFLHHIVEEVEKRGMPMEIALLPIIESSFNPQALSPAQAAGIWQFIPSTGRIYGLDQNHWYDGRRDIVAATQAALDHLQYLQRLFGDWELALAAYNCGEGCVGRAMAKNRAQGLATGFTALSLPAETRNYVPKLLAVRNIVREPERFQIALDSIPNEAYFQIVTLPRPLEAQAAAKLAGMNLDDFLDLNPGFRRKVIYSDAPSKLLIPLNKVSVFNRNLERNAGEMNWLRKYLAQKGESLKQIADRFDVSLSWLREHNPLETGRKGQLKNATTMLVPASGTTVAATLPASRPSAKADAPVAGKAPERAGKEPAKRVAKVAAGKRIHTVRKGDTLSELAERYNVAVADIKALNGKLKVLRPGAKLRIPKANG